MKAEIFHLALMCLWYTNKFVDVSKVKDSKMKASNNAVMLYLVLSAIYKAGIATIGGIYTNFLRSFGLNEFEVNMVNVVFFLMITICEIPTGLFADVFGRKKSFVVSCFLFSLSMFMYAFSQTFFWFAASEAVGAIAATFASGAFQAWLVDMMKHHKHDIPLAKVFSWEQKISGITGMAVVILASWLADFSMKIPWILGGVIFLICGIISMKVMREEYFIKKVFSVKGGLENVASTCKKSWRELQVNKPFRFIIVVSAVQLFAVVGVNMEWQKVFAGLAGTNAALGTMITAIQIAIIIGSYGSDWLLKLFKNDEKKAVLASQIIVGVFIALTVATSSLPIMVTMFLIHEAARGMFRPLKDAYMQKNIPSTERATLGSFDSMSGHFGGALGLVVSGLLADNFGITLGWIFAGITMIVITLFVSKNGRRVG